jgi:DNA repair exonuclease SbcCD ATPase subunit
MPLMNIDWDFNTAEWWIVGIGIGLGGAFLILAIISFVAHTRTKQQRDDARQELERARAELDDARAELDDARQELERVRRQLETTSRRLAPRLEATSAKMSELMEMLKSAREDRRRLGELIAGYRKWADKGLGVLKRVVERPRTRGGADIEDGKESPSAE